MCITCSKWQAGGLVDVSSMMAPGRSKQRLNVKGNPGAGLDGRCRLLCGRLMHHKTDPQRSSQRIVRSSLVSQNPIHQQTKPQQQQSSSKDTRAASSSPRNQHLEELR